MKDCSNEKAPIGCLVERSEPTAKPSNTVALMMLNEINVQSFVYYYSTKTRETGLIFKIFFLGLHLPFFDHPLTNKKTLGTLVFQGVSRFKMRDLTNS